MAETAPVGAQEQRVVGAAILELTGIRKSFGGNRALAGASLSVRTGEIRALVGQNGSGKSTIIKILAGYYEPDEGELRLHGEKIPWPTGREALDKHGVTFLHQDLGLVPTMSIVENLRIGRLRTRGGRIRWKSERTAAAALLARYGLHVDPRAPVNRLTQTQQTILGLVRALEGVRSDTSGLIVLDEPTSALPASEIEALFEAIRTARSAGHGVILVTHHLDEVFQVADMVTVFRAGRDVMTAPVSQVSEVALVETMIGGSLPELPGAPTTGTAPIVLRCQGVSGQHCRDVDLEVSAGEIVGLTGLLGAGQQELPYLIYGAVPITRGSVSYDDRVLHRHTPPRSRKSGMALLPADRQHASGVLNATLQENVSLPALPRFRRRLLIDSGAERSAVSQLLARFDVQPPNPRLPLSALSGGNQQKALLGRWIQENPRLLLLDEPSNGVDVGARQAIFAEIQECARRGMAVLIASSQHDDIAAICTRALIFSRGRVVEQLVEPEITPDALLSACYRGESLAG